MANSFITKTYLVAFNLISFFGWSMILTTLVRHLSFGNFRQTLPIEYSEKFIAFLRNAAQRNIHVISFNNPKLPAFLSTLLDRASTLHATSGALVAVVQSLAALEIVHAIVGIVKTPVPTTVVQVFSRLFLVWGISERYINAAASPWYASMIFAWSVTECVRYPFYANALMGSESNFLQWARYTLFYVLYPLGAGSEAMLMFKTLPNVYPWDKPSAWNAEKYLVAVFFVLWWPGLYVMYTHMIRQRRRALSKVSGFWGTKDANARREAAKINAQRKKGAKAVADGTWATGESNKSK